MTHNAERATPTEAQQAVLTVIDKNGASYIGNRTWASQNTVDWRAVRALERAGLVEVFLGPDGRFARRQGLTKIRKD